MRKTDMSTITEVSRGKSVISSRNIDYVGFANFPNQIFRRCIKNGFEFSLMVVGQSGLGKSTFLNTLFMAELHDLKCNNLLELKSTVKIESKTFRLVENDVRLKQMEWLSGRAFDQCERSSLKEGSIISLTVVDTPGFGDFIDNSKCWEPIVKYIDNRFADYLAEETKVDRSLKIEDKRIHLCIYFISPNGQGLKQLDIAFMKQLQDRVNIVPLIAKADTLTQNELCRFRQQIMDDMRKNNISFYKFPEQFNYEQQPSVLGVTTNGKTQNQHTGGNNISFQLEKRIPFAIVGSTHIKELLVSGEKRASKQKFRVREYPWGVVEVDNLAHNDFIALRDMIIRNNLIDLIETTKCLHYENYRMRNLPKSSFDEDSFTQTEEEILARQLEAEDTRRKQEALFNEGVAIREQRLMERALAMDEEEKENRKALDEKRELYEKLRQN
ncbi:Septin-type G domain-containing protein [Meloidogyne graminicola]|uniref:Septin n=1 Tax=Meloidogyne graminicola TaxID=189291 RepID=A0A8S9ZDY7_9BILA|nr:Septin-type G domain-containing protein [Meloidogyne graminicola]